MPLTLTDVNVGTTPGDGTGDTARVAFQAVNSNNTAVENAVNELRGAFWTIQNSTLNPLVMGERYIANNHAGITYTLPAAFSNSATEFSDIWVANADDASSVTLTPASGDALFVGGVTLGVDVTYALVAGMIAILSPRTSSSEWDVVLVSGASIVGTTGTKAQFDAAVTDGNFMYVGDAPTAHNHTSANVTDFDEAAQDAIGAMIDASLTYVDGTPLLQRAALTGDVTASAGSNATTIAADTVTFAKMQNVNTDRLLGRDAAAVGDVEEISLGASLEWSGTGSIQRAALTGDVTASANSNATAIAANAVTNTHIRDSAALSVIGRSANSTGDPADIAAGVDGEVLRRSGTTLGFGAVATAGIANDAVTLAKIQNAAAASKLLGSGSSGSGIDYAEITLGTGLSMSGTTLNASGSDNALTEAPADVSVSGLTATLTAGEALVFGDMCYIAATTGKMWKADADFAHQVTAMAAATISADATGTFLLQGYARGDALWAWGTIGGAIFSSVTPGSSSQTAPVGVGDRVQVLGYATHADRIWFNPSMDWVVI